MNMKTYVKPQNRIIDLFEDGNLLLSSRFESTEYEVTEDYAEEALSSKKSIWENDNIWK